MENFNELKEIWKQDKFEGKPEVETLIHQFNKKQKRINTRIILLIILILITVLFLLTGSHFKMWSTYLGLSIFSVLAFVLLKTKLRRQNKLNGFEGLSNADFLIELQKKEHQNCNTKSKQQVYRFLAWAFGFLLYIYEPASSSKESLFISYGVLSAYILAVWFFYLPFMERRYQKKIQRTINYIEYLKEQFDEKS